jgi:hypothetical protein
MAFKNTGVICLIDVGESFVDMGDYYINEQTGERVLITRKDLAERYSNFVDVPIYIFKSLPPCHRKGE